MTGLARETPERIIAHTWVPEWEHHVGQEGMRAILSALEQAGFTIVPVEPTEAMIRAGAKERAAPYPTKDVYKAMLSAARQQEAQDNG